MSPWFPINLYLVLAVFVVQAVSECQVHVPEPWPTPYLFLPKDSIVQVNCKAQTGSEFWSVDLASDSPSNIQYRIGDQQLKEDGVYELPSIDTPPTLRLLVNDTAKNNGTELYCGSGETALFVFEPTPFILKVMDMDVNGINISWSQESRSVAVSDADQTFSLTVSHGSSSQVISLNDSFYYFTAPEDASPCEVYNFSVTATYVGATYTGAGCSVPSPVLSTMLPSLPDLGRLESSLHYSLVKDSEELTLNVSFEQATCCDQYPVSNYTLEVKGPSSEVLMQAVAFSSSEAFQVDAGNLSENSVYLFQVLVSNIVGVASTANRSLYTTDVQNVTVTLIDRHGNTSEVQCDFITGSEAKGCKVVIKSAYVSESHLLIRNASANLATLTVTLKHPLRCYVEVEAFDVESDDSIGSVAVPGLLVANFSMETPCPVGIGPINSGTSTTSLWIIVGVAIFLALLIIVTIVMIVLVTILYKRQSETRCKSVSPHLYHCPTVDSPYHNTKPLEGVNHSTQWPVRTASTNGVDGVGEGERRMSEEELKDEWKQNGPLYDLPETLTSVPASGSGVENHYSRTFRQHSDTSGDVHLQGSDNSDYSTLDQNQSVPASGSGVENHYSRTFRQHSDTSGDVHLQSSDNSDYSTLDQNQTVPASGSGVENHYSRTFRQHSDTSGDVHLQSSDNLDYSTLDQNQEHHYHELDPNVADAYPLTSSNSPSPPVSPPVYQEILDFPDRKSKRAKSTSSNERSASCVHLNRNHMDTSIYSSLESQTSTSIPVIEGRGHRGNSAGSSETTDEQNQWVDNTNVGTIV